METSQQDYSAPRGGFFGQAAPTTPRATEIYEVFDEGDVIEVVADLPGFDEEQLSLAADAEQVRIEASASDSMRRESVSIVANLPQEVEPEEAEANLENGVLTVRLPVSDYDDETTINID